MLRIFRRSKLPIWYTEGFNPHPYYSFALALSLGFESGCEILDFNIIDDDMPLSEIKERLNAVMPEGMSIISVNPQRLKITEIAKAEYSFSLVTDDPIKLYEDIQKLLSQEEILIEKKTKRGVKTVDIKPDLEMIKCEQKDRSVDIIMRLPAGTQTNYNPTLFFESLKNAESQPFSAENICRMGIYCKNNEIFS